MTALLLLAVQAIVPPALPPLCEVKAVHAGRVEARLVPCPLLDAIYDAAGRRAPRPRPLTDPERAHVTGRIT